MKHLLPPFLFLTATLLTAACSATAPQIPVDTSSVLPGQTVTRGDTTTLALLGQPLAVDAPLPSVRLVDSQLRSVDIADLRGDVLLLSIVPSLDTQVCERQTHLLGEASSEELPAKVKRVTVSRDLPFAQKRFSDETGFGQILYLSDYQKAEFGRATGLLVDQIFLLARAVVVVDREGIVRYLQVVPELSHLPDMPAAFARARELAAQP